MNILNIFFYFPNLFLEYAVSFLYFNYHIIINFGQHIYLYNILEHTYIRMDNINSLFKKYIKPSPNPNALSFTMVGLSTLMLVYFVAYKEDSPTEDKEEEESRSLDDDDSPYDTEQTTRGGASKRRHKKNKKTKRRKL